ncbi:hypothetical protein C1752_00545 [Acaryochloris thomasi RCC1774]|uniref:Uncharacterized protein n=1 Tax=Acaryochloris thomasi RCC1774 TaxID=1764569 RepID=A0A2W1K0A1_9CYAN|nr:hypothetical protein C1752_00545 [Acaryochloris thomasi RCC1774]
MFKWKVDCSKILATGGKTCQDEFTRYAEVNSTFPLPLKKFILP